MAEEEQTNLKCVVIGAGPVGALAGLYAAKRGCDVEVYDLRPGMCIYSLACIHHWIAW